MKRLIIINIMFYLLVWFLFAQEFAGTLDRTDTLDGKNYIDMYKLELSGGQKYSLRLSSDNFAPHLSLLFPGGVVVGGKDIPYTFYRSEGFLKIDPAMEKVVIELQKQALYTVGPKEAILDFYLPEGIKLLVVVTSRTPGVTGNYKLTVGEQVQTIERVKEFGVPVPSKGELHKSGERISAEVKMIDKTTLSTVWYQMAARSGIIYSFNLTAYDFIPVLFIQTQDNKRYKVSGQRQLLMETGAEMTGYVSIGITGTNPSGGSKFLLELQEQTPANMEEGS